MEIQVINRKISASSWRLALVIGPIMCLMACKIQPCESIFNCLTPNMFKMGKVGQPGAYPGSNPGERASWYPQVQQQPYAMAYGQRPMSRLFQPKWRSPLFGPKRWMDWRMHSANMNFYRPGYGYWPPTGQMPSLTPAIAPINSNTASNYNNQFSEQLSLSPFSSSSSPLLPSTSPYGQQSSSSQLAINNNNNNDGWSVPYVPPYNRPAQLQQPYGDSYSVLPGTQTGPSKQQQDPNNYGTKGASGSNKQQQQSQSQQYGTTKNVLFADGGYNSVDAHLKSYNYPRNYSSTGFGYSYPEWYSGVVESPAKIAQQLYKIQQRRAMLGLKV